VIYNLVPYWPYSRKRCVWDSLETDGKGRGMVSKLRAGNQAHRAQGDISTGRELSQAGVLSVVLARGSKIKGVQAV
jgi:hypothetical protein